MVTRRESFYQVRRKLLAGFSMALGVLHGFRGTSGALLFTSAALHSTGLP